MLRFIVIISFSLLFNYYIQAQTCCSGGVPLSSNLGLPASQANVLQINWSYDLNVLNRLQTGFELEADRARTRRTHSMLLELGYSFSNRISVDLFFSYVRQERRIEQAVGSDFDFTQGIGDVVALLKYKLLSLNEDNTTLTAAVGIKAPLGASNLTDPNGITLNADLQPGSGAWDGIFWAQFTHNLAFRPSMSMAATSTYSWKGTNPDYLPIFDPVLGTQRAQRYGFGNELQIILSLSDRLLLGNALIDPSLTIRYRKALQDEQNEIKLPNTGGEWIFITPGLSYWLLPAFSINANFEVPIYSFIEGTQVAPSYRMNLGVYYRLDLKTKETPFNF